MSAIGSPLCLLGLAVGGLNLSNRCVVLLLRKPILVLNFCQKAASSSHV
ncbi:hypothetical protein ACEXOS_005490 [Herbiconiux sp. P16]